MTEKAETSTQDKQPSAQNVAPAHPVNRPIPTSWGYRGFLLVSTAFFLFELIFVSLYSTTAWFGTDIRFLGIPVVLVLLPVAHQILLSFEQKPLLMLAFPLRNGLPFVIYWNWITLHESALTIGLRKVAYSSIDELKLTIWGNLHIRSRAVRLGNDSSAIGIADAAVVNNEPTDLVFKLPLGVVSPQFQKQLIQTVEDANPNVQINERLKKRLSAHDVSATQMIGVMGAVILLFVLVDLGQSSYTYLEVLKNYYQANVSARKGDLAEAAKSLEKGDRLIKEGLLLSCIKSKFFDEGNGASGVKAFRSEALWFMGRRQDAVDECRQALKLSPRAFRLNLRLARMLNAMNKPDLARIEIEESMKVDKDSFLPLSYRIALEDERGGEAAARRQYEADLKDLDEDLFGEQPVWPPGGERILHVVWHREDLTFVFERLLKIIPHS